MDYADRMKGFVGQAFADDPETVLRFLAARAQRCADSAREAGQEEREQVWLSLRRDLLSSARTLQLHVESGNFSSYCSVSGIASPLAQTKGRGK